MKKIVVAGEEIDNKPVPGFVVTDKGVYKDSGTPSAESFLFGFVYVVCTLVIEKLRFVLVRGIDYATGKFFECSFPCSDLLLEHQNGLVKELMNNGLKVHPRQAESLKVYLANYPVTEVTLAYTTTGWADAEDDRKIFVLPSRFIGMGRLKAVFKPESENPRHAAIHTHGTLDEWNQNIAFHALANPLLMFAIGAASSGPLLEPLNLDGCGFNFYGDSSRGKTIALQVAASVFGNGVDPGRATGKSLIGRWAATQNALEGLAASFNHLPLLMDELGTSSIKNFDVAIYQLTCGTGKEAMNSNRDLKKARTWRVVILSSGEKSISAEIFRTSGREAMTGHLVRFPDISINKGVLTSSDPVASKKVADGLKLACGTYYGTAGVQYLEHLTRCLNDEDGFIGRLNCLHRKIADDLIKTIAHAQPEQMRAVDRFAMVGVALEVMREAGCVSFTSQQIMQCLEYVIKIWLMDFPAVSEAERSFSRIRSYVLSNPSKFGDFQSGGMDRSTPLAGYFNHYTKCYYLTKDQLMAITGRSDVKPIIKALYDQGFLIKGELLPSGNYRMMAKVAIRGTTQRMIAIDKSFFEISELPDASDEVEAKGEGLGDSADIMEPSPPSKPPF